MKTVIVGMSGGVDSSLSAALLKDAGYNVVGVYMKNWTKSLPGFVCPWKEDYLDAKRVAVQLGINFEVYDFEKQYKKLVVDTMIDSFSIGLTPNPDILCNQEIKFKLFYQTALRNGADFIATGHYVRTEDDKLLMAADKNKDQTYFLYRVEPKVLSKTLFPIGELSKPEVRKQAAERHLATAKKKESMGICFVGKVGIKDFLKNYVKTKPGPIVDQEGKQVGEHDGAIFYTIGQRQGLGVGGGLPYYVTGKDMGTNTVHVTRDLNDEQLWSKAIEITAAHWITSPLDKQKLTVRTRHRGPLVKVAKLEQISEKNWRIHLAAAERAVTPGQSAVLYDGETCLGGGIIC